jgi:hypothetical protein
MFAEHPSGIVVVVEAVVVETVVVEAVVVVFVLVVIVVVVVVVVLNSSAVAGQPPPGLAEKHTLVVLSRHGPDDPNAQSLLVSQTPSFVEVVVGTSVAVSTGLPGLVPFTHATNLSPHVSFPADVL